MQLSNYGKRYAHLNSNSFNSLYGIILQEVDYHFYKKNSEKVAIQALHYHLVLKNLNSSKENDSLPIEFINILKHFPKLRDIEGNKTEYDLTLFSIGEYPDSYAIAITRYCGGNEYLVQYTSLESQSEIIKFCQLVQSKASIGLNLSFLENFVKESF